MKWLKRLLVFADLTGADGNLSFSKYVLLITMALVAFAGLDALFATVCVAASFGWKGISAFLNRSNFTAATSFTRKTEKTEHIQTKRDESLGIEESR